MTMLDSSWQRICAICGVKVPASWSYICHFKWWEGLHSIILICDSCLWYLCISLHLLYQNVSFKLYVCWEYLPKIPMNGSLGWGGESFQTCNPPLTTAFVHNLPFHHLSNDNTCDTTLEKMKYFNVVLLIEK